MSDVLIFIRILIWNLFPIPFRQNSSMLCVIHFNISKDMPVVKNSLFICAWFRDWVFWLFKIFLFSYFPQRTQREFIEIKTYKQKLVCFIFASHISSFLFDAKWKFVGMMLMFRIAQLMDNVSQKLKKSRSLSIKTLRNT